MPALAKMYRDARVSGAEWLRHYVYTKVHVRNGTALLQML